MNRRQFFAACAAAIAGAAAAKAPSKVLRTTTPKAFWQLVHVRRLNAPVHFATITLTPKRLAGLIPMTSELWSR